MKVFINSYQPKIHPSSHKHKEGNKGGGKNKCTNRELFFEPSFEPLFERSTLYYKVSINEKSYSRGVLRSESERSRQDIYETSRGNIHERSRRMKERQRKITAIKWPWSTSRIGLLLLPFHSFTLNETNKPVYCFHSRITKVIRDRHAGIQE